MNELEYRVERARGDVSEAESKVREAQSNLKACLAKGQAELEKVRSDNARDYDRFKEELTRAQLKCGVERAWLKLNEENLAKGFTQ